MAIRRLIIFIALVLAGQSVHAECLIRSPRQPGFVVNNDALSILLQQVPRCPQNVGEFKDLLALAGLQTEPYLVNNEGFHSNAGNYSLFESVFGDTNDLPLPIIAGQFFFGHNIAPTANGVLHWKQLPLLNTTLIKIIVWDYAKDYFNFYELQGNGEAATWIYRGDSADILQDVQLLHRVPVNRKQFGQRLSCSGCHLSGGPILKEFGRPFNDWWTFERPLPIGTLRPISPPLQNDLNKVVDASFFAANVRDGIEYLEGSPTYQNLKNSLSMQELLRPLFCPVEINILSDFTPNEYAYGGIQIPSSHFVDPRLAKMDMIIDRNFYEMALTQLLSTFPKTSYPDSDYPWLTPVKSYQDRRAVVSLVRQGFISEEFAVDVLAVDFTNPNFSPFRCELLSELPVIPNENWVEVFLSNLSTSGLVAAPKMIDNIINPQKNIEYHRNRAQEFLKNCARNLNYQEGVLEQVLLLGQRRLELLTNPISRNPLGQILDPKFRVIFPVQNPIIHQIYYWNNEDCRIQAL